MSKDCYVDLACFYYNNYIDIHHSVLFYLSPCEYAYLVYLKFLVVFFAFWSFINIVINHFYVAREFRKNLIFREFSNVFISLKGQLICLWYIFPSKVASNLNSMGNIYVECLIKWYYEIFFDVGQNPANFETNSALLIAY